MKTGPGPGGLWLAQLTSFLCPQNWPVARDTRYVELYVVTDSAEVVWGRAWGQGVGPADGLRASEGLLSSSSGGWGAGQLFVAG